MADVRSSVERAQPLQEAGREISIPGDVHTTAPVTDAEAEALVSLRIRDLGFPAGIERRCHLEDIVKTKGRQGIVCKKVSVRSLTEPIAG